MGAGASTESKLVQEIFKLLDYNEDKQLDKNELKVLFYTFSHAKETSAIKAVEDMVLQNDSNGDGQLDAKQLAEWFKSKEFPDRVLKSMIHLIKEYRRTGGEGAPAPEPVEAAMKNSAFVFVKPHAVNEKAVSFVREKLTTAGLTVLKEGAITGGEIDSKKLIDQHYYAIASKATILTPDKLAVPADKFEAAYNEPWEKVLAEGRAKNAMDACTAFEIDAAALEKAWRDLEKTPGKVQKFGGGFYCGLIDNVEGKPPLYVFNAFFMSMRAQFIGEASIHYFSVEWDAASLTWADFRGKLLGPTNPADGPEGSIRGGMLKDWENLGLASPPDKGSNGVHASASPLEGFAEKSNWLQEDLAVSAFASALVAGGVSADTLKAWSVDPRVPMPGGGEGSIFDALEDLDASACYDKCIAINGAASA